MEIKYNTSYPSVEDLVKKAKRKIPRFAFEYLDGGCNEDVNLHKNTSDLRQIELKPYYLKNLTPPVMQTQLFGHTYDAPFGIAPVGLQGLMWPNAPEILAKAAFKRSIPFILSTVSASSIERISELNEGRIASIRDMRKGKLGIKGAASEEDTEIALKLGLDGVIVSNHGGRQLE